MERLTRERFLELAKAKPGKMTLQEWAQTPEGRADTKRLIDQDRQRISEWLELTRGDGWDCERVAMELHELTGLDIFTLMSMDGDYVQQLVQAGNRKRRGDDSRPLTTQYAADLLLAMLDAGATTNLPAKKDAIETRIPVHRSKVSFRASWDQLRKYGYVGSESSRSGGIFLTEAGKKRANQVKSELSA